MLRRSKSKKFKDNGKLFYSLSLRLDLKPPGVSMVRFYRMTKFYLIFLKLLCEYAKGFILGALISPRNEEYLVSPHNINTLFCKLVVRILKLIR